MTVEENGQGDFVRDRHIEDPELEEKIGELIDLRQSFRRYNRLKREVHDGIRSHLEPEDEDDGTRIVVGRFVAEVKERGGGGIEIPSWRKNVVSGFKETRG